MRAGTRRRAPGALLWALALGTAACVPAGRDEAAVAISAAAGEEARAVPLRFIVHVHCRGCTDCRRSCRSKPTFNDARRSVAAANDTFKATGVHFWISSFERVESPDWWRHGVRDVERTWAEIRPQVLRAFPWVPANAWSDPEETKTTAHWLQVVTAVYARPPEITVHVQQGATRSAAQFPNGGRCVWVSDGGLGDHPRRNNRFGTLYLFAHELAHYFGLRHTFVRDGYNPITGDRWTLADRWDLVYHPGSSPEDPHVFFKSRQEAAAYDDDELRLIHSRRSKHDQSCQENRDSSLECTLAGEDGYSEVHKTGSDALKGLSFPLPPAERRGRFKFGLNATAYGNMSIPRRLSRSQIEMLGIYLRHEQPIGQKSLKSWGALPDGVTVVKGLRPRLGLDVSH